MTPITVIRLRSGLIAQAENLENPRRVMPLDLIDGSDICFDYNEVV